MPYIPVENRNEIDSDGRAPDTPGELNYVITQVCDDYIASYGGVRYMVLNEVIGALECAKLEMYRRLAVPYEDQKLAENGDVYSEEHVL